MTRSRTTTFPRALRPISCLQPSWPSRMRPKPAQATRGRLRSPSDPTSRPRPPAVRAAAPYDPGTAPKRTHAPTYRSTERQNGRTRARSTRHRRHRDRRWARPSPSPVGSGAVRHAGTRHGRGDDGRGHDAPRRPHGPTGVGLAHRGRPRRCQSRRHRKTGVAHIYLCGLGMEVTARSDNVLRCGLTKKHVDAPELLKAVHFAMHPARAVTVLPDAAAGEHFYPAPVDDFRPSRLALVRGEAPRTLTPLSSAPAVPRRLGDRRFGRVCGGPQARPCRLRVRRRDAAVKGGRNGVPATAGLDRV